MILDKDFEYLPLFDEYQQIYFQDDVAHFRAQDDWIAGHLTQLVNFENFYNHKLMAKFNCSVKAVNRFKHEHGSKYVLPTFQLKTYNDLVKFVKATPLKLKLDMYLHHFSLL